MGDGHLHRSGARPSSRSGPRRDPLLELIGVTDGGFVFAVTFAVVFTVVFTAAELVHHRRTGSRPRPCATRAARPIREVSLRELLDHPVDAGGVGLEVGGVHRGEHADA